MNKILLTITLCCITLTVGIGLRSMRIENYENTFVKEGQHYDNAYKFMELVSLGSPEAYVGLKDKLSFNVYNTYKPNKVPFRGRIPYPLIYTQDEWEDEWGYRHLEILFDTNIGPGAQIYTYEIKFNKDDSIANVKSTYEWGK